VIQGSESEYGYGYGYGALIVGVEQTRHAWRNAGISIAALLVLTLALYHQTVLYLTGLWNQLKVGEYAHGYLVLAISIYLILRNRRRLTSLTPCPSYWALPAVAASSLLWLVAVLVDVYMMQTVGLVLLVLAIVWAVLGNQVTRVLVFPILFIGFAIPIWFPLSPLLQDLTADVVFWSIRLLEVPALRQENMILLPAGALSVEEACSGLRYLLAALTLGTLYAYLNFESFRARLVVVLISAIAAVLANIVRVFIVVYLGYVSDMQHPLVHDHLMLGWYLFGGMVFILLLVDARLHRYYRRTGTRDEIKQDLTEHDYTEPVACKKGNLQYMVVLFSGALIVSLGPAAAFSVNNQSHQDYLHVEIDLPESIGAWKSYDDSNEDWVPVYHGAKTRKHIYQKDGDKIVAYIGCYPAQQQGKELINDLNRISNENIWKAIYPRVRLMEWADYQVLEQLLEKTNGKQRLVWYWYSVADRITSNKYEAKLLQLLGFLTGKHQACVIAVATDLGNSPENARTRLRDFVRDAGTSFISAVDGKNRMVYKLAGTLSN